MLKGLAVDLSQASVGFIKCPLTIEEFRQWARELRLLDNIQEEKFIAWNCYGEVIAYGEYENKVVEVAKEVLQNSLVDNYFFLGDTAGSNYSNIVKIIPAETEIKLDHFKREARRLDIHVGWSEEAYVAWNHDYKPLAQHSDRTKLLETLAEMKKKCKQALTNFPSVFITHGCDYDNIEEVTPEMLETPVENKGGNKLKSIINKHIAALKEELSCAGVTGVEEIINNNISVDKVAESISENEKYLKFASLLTECFVDNKPLCCHIDSNYIIASHLLQYLLFSDIVNKHTRAEKSSYYFEIALLITILDVGETSNYYSITDFCRNDLAGFLTTGMVNS